MEMGSHIRSLLNYNLKLPDVYVGIVGWIYGTKIDPISILHPYPCFITFFLSNGHGDSIITFNATLMYLSGGATWTLELFLRHWSVSTP